MSKGKEIAGQTFGLLLAIREVAPIPRPDKPGWSRRAYLCRCFCGKELIVTRESLISGNTKSCGCLNHQKGRPARRKTHGKTETRLYRIWCHMKARCDQPNNNRYYRYGARGIKVCDEWHDSFEAFERWALSHGYADALSIERIDNDKGYSPENCKWIPLAEQSKNRGSKHGNQE